MEDQFHNNSIFWIDVEKIKPNPYQPRVEFDERKLQDLADSIRQYGILQPLVVTRQEVEKKDGGLMVEYELIAGERRLRASKISGLLQVPVIIRSGKDDNKVKLELAIIENLQREDLNPVDRARAFSRLVNEFGFKHVEVAKKVGMSRVYVSNTLRLLALPEDMLLALSAHKITEGHTRPLLMLIDRPAEQQTLFKEIIIRKINVREAEQIARRVAYDKVRKKDKMVDPELIDIEERLTENLGTRVQIDRKNEGGRITISFFSQDDLRKIVEVLNSERKSTYMPPTHAAGPISHIINDVTTTRKSEWGTPVDARPIVGDGVIKPKVSYVGVSVENIIIEIAKKAHVEEELKRKEDDLYFIENFSL